MAGIGQVFYLEGGGGGGIGGLGVASFSSIQTP